MVSIATADVNDAKTTTIGWAALGISLTLLAAVEIWLSTRFGFWIDEFFSLWTTDPSLDLGRSLVRLAGDTNPPLYYALLRIVRVAIHSPHAAILVGNAVAFAAAAAFVAWVSERANVPTLALFGVAAFAASGSTYYYMLEGRAYFLAACLSFASAWQVALIVAQPEAGRRPGWLAGLGAAAALTHLFAGMFAGCLALGLCGYGILSRRKDLVLPGLVLGASASVVAALWSWTAMGRSQAMSWIVFDRAALIEAVWYVRTLTIGPSPMLAPLAILFGVALWRPSTRPIAIVFAIAGFAFVVLPMAISLRMPLVNGRYWQIGAAPGLLVVLVFSARALLAERSRFGTVVAAATAVFLAATAATGVVAADRFLTIKPVWNGVPIVSKLARGCPAGSVHVPAQYPFVYPVAANLPPALFISVDDVRSTPAGVGRCPVLAWAEHVTKGERFVFDASDQELLDLMKLGPASDGMRVLRHRTGFVVVRTDARLD